MYQNKRYVKMVSSTAPVSFSGNLNTIYSTVRKLSASERRAFGKSFINDSVSISPKDFKKKFGIDITALSNYVKRLPVDVDLKVKQTLDRFSIVMHQPKGKEFMANSFVRIGDMTQDSVNKVTQELVKVSGKTHEVKKPVKLKQLSLLF